MNIGDIGGIQGNPSAFTAKVSEKQEDVQEKVVNTLIESTEATAPDRSGFETGQNLDEVA